MGYQGPSFPLIGKCWNTNITVHIETSFILPRSVKVVTKKEASAPKSTPLQLPMWKSLMPSGEKFLRQRLNHSSLKLTQKQIQHNNIYIIHAGIKDMHVFNNLKKYIFCMFYQCQLFKSVLQSHYFIINFTVDSKTSIQ